MRGGGQGQEEEEEKKKEKTQKSSLMMCVIKWDQMEIKLSLTRNGFRSWNSRYKNRVQLHQISCQNGWGYGEPLCLDIYSS